ncbi:hypothetical protein PHLGIDRAFT_17372 [Phlebiopsis gigantea 11061_1 CR5-6]|uniref:Uncharacterized protein n=1 Tax=Phlebiopsis gigantea (strain 11061_1 CR5-6) TaxID=745531 RepID=A0A0C3N9L7_PHLG1|nr:hypothetical protein PHLGIDRAFT_17372 [Phlebiopsis gigantea 11061_1 CR5-6]
MIWKMQEEIKPGSIDQGRSAKASLTHQTLQVEALVNKLERDRARLQFLKSVSTWLSKPTAHINNGVQTWGKQDYQRLSAESSQYKAHLQSVIRWANQHVYKSSIISVDQQIAEAMKTSIALADDATPSDPTPSVDIIADGRIQARLARCSSPKVTVTGPKFADTGVQVTKGHSKQSASGIQITGIRSSYAETGIQTLAAETRTSYMDIGIQASKTHSGHRTHSIGPTSSSVSDMENTALFWRIYGVWSILAETRTHDGLDKAKRWRGEL